MHSTARHFIIVSSSIAAFTFAGGAAFAGVIQQGSDYSNADDGGCIRWTDGGQP